MSDILKRLLDLGAEIKYKRQGRLTLRDMIRIADIPLSSLDKSLLSELEHPIKQICFSRKRMVPDSIAFVSFGLYEESFQRMKKAVAGGAVAVVVKNAVPGIPCIVTPDPLNIYAKMCAYYRDLNKRVGSTAVTGSIGKTTVKNMVASVYGEKFRTLVEPLNENEPDIVGFSAQHLSSHIDKWVQEVAESIPGSASDMSLIMKPEVVIITTIDHSHIGRLGSIENIIDEACGVADCLTEDGIVIVNKDEFYSYEKLNGKQVVTISMSDKTANYFAGDIELKDDGFHYSIYENTDSGIMSVRVHLHDIFAQHNVLNSLYAYAAGRHSGISPEMVARGLGKYKTTGYRNNVYRSVSGKDIIYADCFNAVGRSIKAALDAASVIPIGNGCQRIAVLGDVQELGEAAVEEHKRILETINESNFDQAILYGDNFKTAVSGMSFRSGLQVNTADSIEEIVSVLKPLLSKGNLFLFKSSHSGHLERCIEELWPKSFRKKEKEEMRLKTKWKIMLMLP